MEQTSTRKETGKNDELLKAKKEFENEVSLYNKEVLTKKRNQKIFIVISLLLVFFVFIIKMRSKMNGYSKFIDPYK